MNRRIITGAVIFACSCVAIDVSYACEPFDIYIWDYYKYVPVGGDTVDVTADVVEGGPAYDWEWDYPNELVISGDPSENDYDSTATFSGDTAGTYTVWAEAWDYYNTYDNDWAYVKVVEVTDVIGSKYVLAVGEEWTYAANTNPSDSGDNVNITWDTDGGDYTLRPGDDSVCTVSWDTPGTKTLTAHCGTSSASKEITIFTIKSETLAAKPAANKDRTTIGLGEQVRCYTEPSILVDWNLDSYGELSPTSDSDETIFSSATAYYHPTITAQTGSASCSISFDVIPPSTMTVTHKQTNDYDLVEDPNGTLIGPGQAEFDCIFDQDVNFYRAQFRENIPETNWTWLNGTQGSRQAGQPTYSVGDQDGGTAINWSPDYCSEGPFPRTYLWGGYNYQSHSHTIPVPVEYEDASESWFPLFPDSTHEYIYAEAGVAHVVFDSADSDEKGPWKEE